MRSAISIAANDASVVNKTMQADRKAWRTRSRVMGCFIPYLQDRHRTHTDCHSGRSGWIALVLWKQ